MHNQRFAFTFAAPGRCLEARASTREPVPLKIFDQKKEVFFPNTKVLGCLNCGHDCRGDHTGIEVYFADAIFSHLRLYDRPSNILRPTPKSLHSARIHFLVCKNETDKEHGF